MFSFIKSYIAKRRAARIQKMHISAKAFLDVFYTTTPSASPAPSKPKPESIPSKASDGVRYSVTIGFNVNKRKVLNTAPTALAKSQPKPPAPKKSKPTPDTILFEASDDARFSIMSTKPANHNLNQHYATALFHLKETKKEQTFIDTLFAHMRKKGLTAPIVYKRANIDKRHYSKIISNRNSSPSRDVAISLAIALELTYNEAQAFLGAAGYTLSQNCKRDVLVHYCLNEGIYKIIEVNLLLEGFNEKPF